MKDLYFACCVSGGGILHYVKDGDRFVRRGVRHCDRPMYMDIDGDTMHVLLRAPYTDNDHSAVIDFPVRSDGSLGEGGSMTDTRGSVACHVCHSFGKVYYTNYLSGSVASRNGVLSVHSGKSVHPTRQEAPHTHFVSSSPDGRYLLSADLGLDTVFTYDEDLNIVSAARTPEGHGPRHLAYACDGRTVFCVNELMSTVSVFGYSDGRLTLLDTVPALFEPDPDNFAAAIRVRGDLVYVSQRGADAVSVMSWRDGRLALLGVYPCGGRSPRDILIVDDHLLCADEGGDKVTVLRINGDRLELTGTELEMPSPLCIAAI